MLGNDPDVIDGRKVVAEFDGEPYYIATPAGSPLIDGLNDAMSLDIHRRFRILRRLDVKHMPSRYRTPIGFSDADRAYIEQAGVVGWPSWRTATRSTTSATASTRAS